MQWKKIRTLFLIFFFSCALWQIPTHVMAEDINLTVPEPNLKLYSFYDSKRNTNPTFTVSGITDAFATVTVSIFPDNVKGAIRADQMGRFQFTPAKALTNGSKQVTISVTTDKGGYVAKTEKVTVTGAFVFPIAEVLFILAILGGIGIYVYFQLKKSGTTMQDLGTKLQARFTPKPKTSKGTK